ncbi:MAG: hypothetical protein SGJ13_12995 [Actinomycetota bacterium]|nr:hypothetical protein [Actinomycetota bacterium]
MGIRKGQPWGDPISGPPAREVAGSDLDLADAVAAAPGARLRFRPDVTSDLARAIGLGGPEHDESTELNMDALAVDGYGLAVNAVVLGVAPDRLGRFSRAHEIRVTVDGHEWFAERATTFLCATGQFLRGCDLVPRGHPGDGRAEVQAYLLRPGERRAMRSRLPGGGHVPHPRIRQGIARRIVVSAATPMALEVDGGLHGPVTELVVEVRPGAYRLLV